MGTIATICCGSKAPQEGQRYGDLRIDESLGDADLPLTGEGLPEVKTPLEQKWLRAVFQNGLKLKDAPKEIQAHKGIVMVATSGKAGVAGALHYACEGLRRDKDLISRAVEKDPVAIAYALGGVHRDVDIVGLCGLLSADAAEGKGRIIYLSGKLTLFAVLVHLALLKHPTFKEFNIYNPTFVWPKMQQDPESDEEEKEESTTTLSPDDFHAYDAQWHLEQAKENGGFMLQVRETDSSGRPALSKDQFEEQEIARVCEVKTLKLDQPHFWNVGETSAVDKRVEVLAKQVAQYHRH